MSRRKAELGRFAMPRLHAGQSLRFNAEMRQIFVYLCCGNVCEHNLLHGSKSCLRPKIGLLHKQFRLHQRSGVPEQQVCYRNMPRRLFDKRHIVYRQRKTGNQRLFRRQGVRQVRVERNNMRRKQLLRLAWSLDVDMRKRRRKTQTNQAFQRQNVLLLQQRYFMLVHEQQLL